MVEDTEILNLCVAEYGDYKMPYHKVLEAFQTHIVGRSLGKARKAIKITLVRF